MVTFIAYWSIGASTISFARMSEAFFSVMTFSLAAGIKMSHFLFRSNAESFTKVAFEQFSKELCLSKYFFACSTFIPFSLNIPPLYSAIPIRFKPSSSVKNFDK